MHLYMCIRVCTCKYVCVHRVRTEHGFLFVLQSVDSSLLSVDGEDTQLKELHQQLLARDTELAAVVKEKEEMERVKSAMEESMCGLKEQVKEMQVSMCVNTPL